MFGGWGACNNSSRIPFNRETPSDSQGNSQLSDYSQSLLDDRRATRQDFEFGSGRNSLRNRSNSFMRINSLNFTELAREKQEREKCMTNMFQDELHKYAAQIDAIGNILNDKCDQILTSCRSTSSAEIDRIGKSVDKVAAEQNNLLLQIDELQKNVLNSCKEIQTEAKEDFDVKTVEQYLSKGIESIGQQVRCQFGSPLQRSIRTATFEHEKTLSTLVSQFDCVVKQVESMNVRISDIPKIQDVVTDLDERRCSTVENVSKEVAKSVDDSCLKLRDTILNTVNQTVATALASQLEEFKILICSEIRRTTEMQVQFQNTNNSSVIMSRLARLEEILQKEMASIHRLLELKVDTPLTVAHSAIGDYRESISSKSVQIQTCDTGVSVTRPTTSSSSFNETLVFNRLPIHKPRSLLNTGLTKSRNLESSSRGGECLPQRKPTLFRPVVPSHSPYQTRSHGPPLPSPSPMSVPCRNKREYRSILEDQESWQHSPVKKLHRTSTLPSVTCNTVKQEAFPPRTRPAYVESRISSLDEIFGSDSDSDSVSPVTPRKLFVKSASFAGTDAKAERSTTRSPVEFADYFL